MLNAFRHQRFNTALFSGLLPIALMCSTPFGIRDSTRYYHATTCGWLLCSTPFGIRDSTREFRPRLRTISLCSTPFGIRDSTLLIPGLSKIISTSVLNAFRHQRFNTESSAKQAPALSCAQRLSASEIQHRPCSRYELAK